MSEDKRNVLEVLRYELNFLEQGGYSRAVRMGSAISPFQDTLSCLNFGEPLRPHACHECLLYDFVPEECRAEDTPCHFIPLDDDGTTISKLLATLRTDEIENLLRRWLKKTIALLESQEQTRARGA